MQDSPRFVTAIKPLIISWVTNFQFLTRKFVYQVFYAPLESPEQDCAFYDKTLEFKFYNREQITIITKLIIYCIQYLHKITVSILEIITTI